MNNLNQQLYNFQANRDQQLSRRSSLTGNFTIQRVDMDFHGSSPESSVTTTTGRLNYRNIAVFGVPKLGFSTNVLVSAASDDNGVDRKEWFSRLDYLIGQLTTGLSFRVIRYDDLEYKLTYFRIQRQF